MDAAEINDVDLREGKKFERDSILAGATVSASPFSLGLHCPASPGGSIGFHPSFVGPALPLYQQFRVYLECDTTFVPVVNGRGEGMYSIGAIIESFVCLD